MLLAAIVTLDDAMAALRQAAILAIIFFLACAIKLTAVIPFAVMLAFVAVAYRRIAAAAVSTVIFTLALGAFSAILYRLYGFEFVFQTFVFHLHEGPRGRLRQRGLSVLDHGLADAAVRVRCWRVFAERRFERGLILILATICAEYAFYGVLSPTAWAHNYLEVIPFIAIVAGIGAADLAAALRDLISSEDPSESRWRLLAAGGALIAICLVWITPLMNENWLHGSVYGFGFVPRAEIAQLADALRNSSKPDDDVIAPSFICFAAGRRELVRYPETYGVYREAETEVDRDGFFAARRHLGKADFFQLISDTRHFWTEQMRATIESGKVSAVISDSPIQLLPLVLIPDDYLTQNGFRPVLTAEHFTLWARAKTAEAQ